MIRAGIAGASGYVGGELLRLLLEHPHVEIGTLGGHSSAGDSIEMHHPHLHAIAGTVIQPLEARSFEADDVVFLALPHGRSADFAVQLDSGRRVVDCGADFRLDDGDAWRAFYGTEHAGTWPYGLPELPGARERLRVASRVAVPGCYPTATTLAVWPALAAGLVSPDIIVVAASGTSGAGRALKPNLLGSEVMGAMSAYGLGGVHRHVPEIRQVLSSVAGRPVTVSFTPTLAPMPRGILATVVAPLADGVDVATVEAAYENAYGHEPFVHLLSRSQQPSTASTLGSNTAQVKVVVDDAARKLVAVAVIDNLTKGTAGQAIQCLNLMAGLDEVTGLPRNGMAP